MWQPYTGEEVISTIVDRLHAEGHIEPVSVDQDGEMRFAITTSGRIYLRTLKAVAWREKQRRILDARRF